MPPGTTLARGCRPWGGSSPVGPPQCGDSGREGASSPVRPPQWGDVGRGEGFCPVGPQPRFSFKAPAGAAAAGGLRRRALRPPGPRGHCPVAMATPPAPFTCKTPDKGGGAGPGAARGASAQPRRGAQARGYSRSGAPGPAPRRMPRLQPGATVPGSGYSGPGAGRGEVPVGSRCWPRWRLSGILMFAPVGYRRDPSGIPGLAPAGSR